MTKLKNLQDEIKRCTLDILIDKGYTLVKAKEVIESIKNFNVYETKTGFRIEALVEGYKIIVFHHTDNIRGDFYSDEKDPNTTTKTVTIQDENNALIQGRMVNAFEHQTNERIQKLENWVSTLQSLVDVNTEDINAIHGEFKSLDTLNDDIECRIKKLEKGNEALEKHDTTNYKRINNLKEEYSRLIKCNNRNATTLNVLYNTIKNYGCGLSERLLEIEQKENPSK